MRLSKSCLAGDRFFSVVIPFMAILILLLVSLFSGVLQRMPWFEVAWELSGRRSLFFSSYPFYGNPNSTSGVAFFGSASENALV
ncbi:MAG: hypothetical protein SWX82_05370 [Cyanobacteriota bacterium]|nr:hypothetical protein [Cyanobacteriota bacterium]